MKLIMPTLWGTFNGLSKGSKSALASRAMLVKVGPQVTATSTIAVGITDRLEYCAVNMEKAWAGIPRKDSNQTPCKEPILPFEE